MSILFNTSPYGRQPRGRWLQEACVFGLVRLAFLLLCALCMNGCSKPPAPASSAPAKAAAKSATNAVAASQTSPASTNELAWHRSVFDPFSGGRDPFFPRTSRLPKSLTNALSGEQLPRLPLSSYIKLTGLSPSKNRPSAMINQTTFEPGEQASVTVVITNAPGATETHPVQVRCLEIRKESVLITVEGENGVKELRMPAVP